MVLTQQSEWIHSSVEPGGTFYLDFTELYPLRFFTLYINYSLCILKFIRKFQGPSLCSDPVSAINAPFEFWQLSLNFLVLNYLLSYLSQRSNEMLDGNEFGSLQVLSKGKTFLYVLYLTYTIVSNNSLGHILNKYPITD